MIAASVIAASVAQEQTGPTSGDVNANRYIGIAAIITAIGAIVLGLYRSRNDREIAAAAREAKQEAVDAKSTVAHAQTTASLAGSVAQQAAARADEQAIQSGVVDEFRRTIQVLTTQLIDMSQSTSSQLSRSTDALVACERREANLMTEMAGLRTQMVEMSAEIVTLRQVVAQWYTDDHRHRETGG